MSAAAHLAFIRPLVAGAESNLVLLTAAGAVIPVVVVERSDAPVDAVVRLGPVDGPATGPVLASVAAVAAARLATQAARDADREAYPRQLQFAYVWAGDEPRAAPFFVEGMWHDGERTYLRTRATAPVLYEQGADGAVTAVPVETVVGGVVSVVPRVLGPGVSRSAASGGRGR